MYSFKTALVTVFIILPTSFTYAAHHSYTSNFLDHHLDFDEKPRCIDQSHNSEIDFACRSANRTQKAKVKRGNKKKEKLHKLCLQETQNSHWCSQILRPNPHQKHKFRCTYGSSLPHQLIHPDESTWVHAITAVQIIQELEAKGIEVCLVYNWWRPEPYNKNIGGSPTRHPYGTSVDVRFCSKADQNKAWFELCKMRAAGRVRAVGYYGPPALHFGVGDHRANTWGRICPQDQ